MDAQELQVDTFGFTHRLRNTRGLAIYLLLVIATPVIGAKAVVQLRTWASTSSFNLPTTPELEVYVLRDVWPDIEDMDRIVAVDGIPVRTVAELRAAERATPDGPVTIRFAHGDHEYERIGQKTKPSTVILVAAILRCATGLALLVIGLVVFLLRPGIRATWLFMLLCSALGVILSSIFAFDDVVVRTIVINSLLAIAPGLAIDLFSELRNPERDRRWMLWLHAAGLALALFYIPTVLFVPSLAEISILAILAWTAIACVWAIAIVVAQLRETKRSGDPRRWAQARSLAIGVALGMLVPSLGLLAWQLQLIAVPGITFYVSTPCVFFALIVGYTVVRHNTFEVDRFTASVAGYLATLGLLGGAVIVTAVGLPLILGKIGVARSPELYVGLTAVVVIGGLPLYRRARTQIDRWFRRGTVDAAERLREVSAALQGDDGLLAAVDAALATGTNRASLWVLDEAGETWKCRARRGDDADESWPRNGALAIALASSDEPRGVAGLADVVLPRDAQIELWRTHHAVAAPIRVFGTFAGLLAVGRKRSGASFTAADLSYLGAIAAQLGIALERTDQAESRMGNYRLGKRLGVGGMAEVFAAWQTGPGGFERRVALKRPLPALIDDPASIAMFLDEARIAAQLSHPNIASVVEIAKHEATYFIAMEYIDGPALRAVIKAASERGEMIPVPIATSIAAGILAALGHAHAATDANGAPLNVVHRDVTPGNVLLSTRGEVKLVDFGIARANARLVATRTGGVKGTVAYMSPEQAAGSPVDARSDLYAAGVTIYEIFTAERAQAEGPGRAPIIPATLRRPDLPAAIDDFLARAMAAKMDDRPSSAAAMLEELLAATGVRAADSDVAQWLADLQTKPAEPEPTTAKTVKG